MRDRGFLAPPPGSRCLVLRGPGGMDSRGSLLPPNEPGPRPPPVSPPAVPQERLGWCLARCSRPRFTAPQDRPAQGAIRELRARPLRSGVRGIHRVLEPFCALCVKAPGILGTEGPGLRESPVVQWPSWVSSFRRGPQEIWPGSRVAGVIVVAEGGRRFGWTRPLFFERVINLGHMDPDGRENQTYIRLLAPPAGPKPEQTSEPRPRAALRMTYDTCQRSQATAISSPTSLPTSFLKPIYTSGGQIKNWNWKRPDSKPCTATPILLVGEPLLGINLCPSPQSGNSD